MKHPLCVLALSASALVLPVAAANVAAQRGQDAGTTEQRPAEQRPAQAPTPAPAPAEQRPAGDQVNQTGEARPAAGRAGELPRAGAGEQRPAGEQQRPGAGPERPGNPPQRPGAEGQRPPAEGQRPGAEPQRPGAEGQRPGAEGQRPGAEPQRPGAGQPQRPAAVTAELDDGSALRVMADEERLHRERLGRADALRQIAERQGNAERVAELQRLVQMEMERHTAMLDQGRRILGTERFDRLRNHLLQANRRGAPNAGQGGTPNGQPGGAQRPAGQTPPEAERGGRQRGATPPAGGEAPPQRGGETPPQRGGETPPQRPATPPATPPANNPARGGGA
jgi:hypothetical protein